ncbi:MAG: DUF1254 domain-containing protein [Anaerolineales bacterium]|nr:DUF1254 domain-containing protein [Anaerolineales bacterium]
MMMTVLVVALLLTVGLTGAAEPPKMKMTTEIPEGIATPDKVSTRVGNFVLRDGIPDQESIENVYDYLDFHNGVQAYLNGIQIASMSALRKGILEFGPPNTTALIFEELMDSKALFLTANTTSVYMVLWLEMKKGEPMVIETPPDVLGIIDDHWFKYVTDFGRLGPDKNKGGKFLILPPGCQLDQKGRNNALNHFVLEREDVLVIPIIALCPEVSARCGVDELSIDSDTAGSLTHTPFEHISHAELLGHLSSLDRLPLVREC